jgi:hypothetical protein
MSQSTAYLNSATHPVVAIVTGVDKDVEHGEDILMLGYSLVLMAPIFAPIAPPRVLNFLGIRTKLAAAMAALDSRQDLSLLKPITEIFAEHPKSTLTEGFNPLKNWQRTAKSILGAMMINSFWMPIFYMLGLQFAEEKQLSLLNRAVMEAEKKTSSWR